MYSGTVFLEAILILGCCQMLKKCGFQNMLKCLRNYGRDSNPALVVGIREIPLLVLNQWYQKAHSKLIRDK